MWWGVAPTTAQEVPCASGFGVKPGLQCPVSGGGDVAPGGGSQRVAQHGSLILTSFAELPSCSGLGAEHSIAPADDPFCRK